jgi:hypothetical protein
MPDNAHELIKSIEKLITPKKKSQVAQWMNVDQ